MWSKLNQKLVKIFKVEKEQTAEEVIEEIAAFPAGDHDDYVDSTTQALLRFRQGGFVRLQSDEEDEEIPWYRKRKAAYY